MWQNLIALFKFLFIPKEPIIVNPMVPSNTPPKPQNAPVSPVLSTTSLMVQFCNEIQNMEGWSVGSTSYIHNNPGNLRCPPLNVLADSCVSGFCHFKDEPTGMKALINVTTSCAKGLSTTYNAAAKQFGITSGANLNLIQYFLIRDPQSDDNDPLALAARFGKKLGVNESTFLMKDLLA